MLRYYQTVPSANVRCCSRKATVRVLAQQQQGTVPKKSGPTGLDVSGSRPTSPKAWGTMSSTLRDAKLKMLSAQEVVFAQERGAAVIDIRPTDLYTKGHVPGARNVPFYQPISGWSAWQVARRLGYALLGALNGTEINPNFDAEIAAILPNQASPAIIYCSLGGKLATEDDKNGLQSRGLIACYGLTQLGYSNLAIMKGGYGEWETSGRQGELEDGEEQDLGATS